MAKKTALTSNKTVSIKKKTSISGNRGMLKTSSMNKNKKNRTKPYNRQGR
jgi:hypothetical protein|tara:strand:- start:110 stop:259 length:150 start_codon:yes stop_codon:yes gene_type:complete